MLMLLAILAVAASILYLIFTSSGSLEKGVYRGAEDVLCERSSIDCQVLPHRL